MLTKMSKQCIKCSIVKSIDDFQFRSDTKKYRNECKRCRQEYVNSYRRENNEYKSRYNVYRKERRKQDQQYALMDRMRARVRKMLRSQNGITYYKTQELLGCSFEKFKEHITN